MASFSDRSRAPLASRLPIWEENGVGQTVAQRTAIAIRELILAVEPGYQPGERLFPDALAVSMGVSITPVREALRHLNSEGFVELLPRRGARVASMTIDEIADLTAVRAGVDALALRTANGQYSEDELAEMDGCLDVCETAMREANAPTYRSHETEFHRLLIASSHSAILMDVYNQVHWRSQILELYFQDTWPTRKLSLAEHRELLHMLRERATRENVEAAIYTHWEQSRIRISNSFTQVAHPPEESQNQTQPPSRGHGGRAVEVEAKEQ
jgi:DNA-binding GntR family transcriptional regulator